MRSFFVHSISEDRGSVSLQTTAWQWDGVTFVLVLDQLGNTLSAALLRRLAEKATHVVALSVTLQRRAIGSARCRYGLLPTLCDAAIELSPDAGATCFYAGDRFRYLGVPRPDDRSGDVAVATLMAPAFTRNASASFGPK
jgi:hypothetical protein